MDDDDDKPALGLNLGPTLRRYAELYPSVIPRLRQILASQDPQLRKRIAQFASAVQGAEHRRLEGLMAAYRLTRTEARLALHIIDGGSLASYAEAAAVSVGTARVQLKSVFAKTRVSRQAELVRIGQAEL